jgi:hypothetical protein
MLYIQSQLVTYRIPLVPCASTGKKQQTFHLVDFVQHLVKSDYKPKSVDATSFAGETYPNPVEYYPLTPFHLTE